MSESERPSRRTRRRPGPSPRKVAFIFVLIGMSVCAAYVLVMSMLLSRS